MIRQATPSDIPSLVEMGRRFHALSPWRDVPFDPESAAASLEQMMGSEAFALLVADDSGVKGAIGVTVAPVYFAAATMAQEAFWWCESPRDALNLLRAAEYWAKRKGACRLVMVRLDGVRDEAVDKLYRRMGYTPAEHHYVKGL